MSSKRLPDPFHSAFQRLKDSVTPDDARLFQNTQMQDVWSAARALERQLEDRGSLIAFRRMEPFLLGLEQYAKVIEPLKTTTTFNSSWDSSILTYLNSIGAHTGISEGAVQAPFPMVELFIDGHTAWKILFDSLWRTFDSRFRVILESMAKHRDLIDQEASTTDIVQARAFRQAQLFEFQNWRQE
ncbi:MAG: hypothetical protein Q9167_003170 [Letrouitia subvulpina]